MTNPFDTPEWREYAERAETELLPMIEKSAITMQLHSGKPDAKVAIEMGFSILLDKPILIMTAKGEPIPAKLRAVADEIVEYDPANMAASGDAVAAAVARMVKVKPS